MARNKKRRDLCLPPSIREELLDFACGQVELVALDGAPTEDTPPAGWVVRNLIKFGAIGYRNAGDPLDGWWIINKMGVRDRYGRPTSVFARTDATDYAATAFDANYTSGGGLHIMRANGGARPPVFTIDRYAELIQRCDLALSANIVASMRSVILGVQSGQEDSVDFILADAAAGLPSVISTDLAESIRPVDISVPFMARDIHAMRQTLYAEALKHFGGVTPTEYKAERVQSAEVSAHVAEAIDNVYVMIDTFNADAKAQGVPYRLSYVGEGSAYVATGDGKEETNEELRI